MRYPHRTYCDALAEIREIVSKLSIFNFHKSKDVLALLVEEMQTYGNRMESGLSYSHNIDKLHKKRKELQIEVDTLNKALGKKESRRSSWQDLVDEIEEES